MLFLMTNFMIYALFPYSLQSVSVNSNFLRDFYVFHRIFSHQFSGVQKKFGTSIFQCLPCLKLIGLHLFDHLQFIAHFYCYPIVYVVAAVVTKSLEFFVEKTRTFLVHFIILNEHFSNLAALFNHFIHYKHRKLESFEQKCSLSNGVFSLSGSEFIFVMSRKEQ